MTELDVVVHRDADMYWADAPAHPGLFASGETIDELLEAIREAWWLYSGGYGTDEAAPTLPATLKSMQIFISA